MKFKDEHYNTLKQCIAEKIALAFKSEKIATSLQQWQHKCMSEGKITETRFLWDLLWASKWTTVYRDQYNEGNYKDAHIQTALKQAVLDITRGNYEPVNLTEVMSKQYTQKLSHE